MFKRFLPIAAMACLTSALPGLCEPSSSACLATAREAAKLLDDNKIAEGRAKLLECLKEANELPIDKDEKSKDWLNEITSVYDKLVGVESENRKEQLARLSDKGAVEVFNVITLDRMCTDSEKMTALLRKHRSKDDPTLNKLQARDKDMQESLSKVKADLPLWIALAEESDKLYLEGRFAESREKLLGCLAEGKKLPKDESDQMKLRLGMVMNIYTEILQNQTEQMKHDAMKGTDEKERREILIKYLKSMNGDATNLIDLLKIQVDKDDHTLVTTEAAIKHLQETQKRLEDEQDGPPAETPSPKN